MTSVRAINSVVVVGGGTAGWITAGTLASRLQARIARGDLTVTLCESPNIPIVGVGEGTWPTMRDTLKSMGIAEGDFIRECDVSFKQGSKFVRWGRDEDGCFYHHPFSIPQGAGTGHLAEYWLAHADEMSFSQMFCPQEAVGEAGLAPKTITMPQYEFALNYGYHLNAAGFSTFLQKHCVDTLGVRHVLADVGRVNLDASGMVESVSTEQHGDISGDLFVDCTGFRSLLLGEALGVEFVDKSDILFADTALALQVPYADAGEAIASFTIATAQEAGWIWEIGLPTRRGIGHVFSSRHMSSDEATSRLLAYVEGKGCDSAELVPREIRFRTGHRAKFWEKNCVAVGLSAGFLEPLEASALITVELSALAIAEQLPRTYDSLRVTAKRYNETFLYRWQRVIDFLKLHYILSERGSGPDGQAFWADNKAPETIPGQLQELMELWRYKVPVIDDFFHAKEVFQAASYQYVMYGSGFRTDPVFPQSDSVAEVTGKIREQAAADTTRLSSGLPNNQDLIAKIRKYGLTRT